MNPVFNWAGKRLAGYLAGEVPVNPEAHVTPPALLRATLRPGDVLLVEGNSRVSTAIKYVTESTWSHAALYIGPYLPISGGKLEHCLIDVDTVKGVRSVGIDVFEKLPTRICRPIGLGDKDRQHLIDFAIERIGFQYDLRNVFDLARYLLPTPPVPLLVRRKLLGLGSGDPTRAICSTLIAQAFQSIRYPILPISKTRTAANGDGETTEEEVFLIRHHSLFTPRDFDVSPYFEVIKPILTNGFDYHAVRWQDAPSGLEN